MNYTGPLYGKIGRRFIPLSMTSDDVDALEQQRDQLAAALKRMVKAEEATIEEFNEAEINELEAAMEQARSALATVKEGNA